jgi:hypothetical protein
MGVHLAEPVGIRALDQQPRSAADDPRKTGCHFDEILFKNSARCRQHKTYGSSPAVHSNPPFSLPLLSSLFLGPLPTLDESTEE